MITTKTIIETKLKINIYDDDPGNDPDPLGGLVTTIIANNTDHKTIGEFAHTRLVLGYALVHDDTLNVSYTLDTRYTISLLDHNSQLVSEFISYIHIDSLVLIPCLHRTPDRYMIGYGGEHVFIISSSGTYTRYISALPKNKKIDLWGGTLYHQYPPKFIIEGQHGKYHYHQGNSGIYLNRVYWSDGNVDGWNQVQIESSSCNRIIFKNVPEAVIMIDPSLNEFTYITGKTLAGNFTDAGRDDGRGFDARFTELRAMTLCSSQVNSHKIKFRTLATLNKSDVLSTWPPGITNIVAHLASYVSSYLLVVDGCRLCRVTLPIEFR